jgi:hypothetical protein
MREPRHIRLDRVAVLTSKVAPARAGENFRTGNADIFKLHVLVDHKTRSVWSGPNAITTAGESGKAASLGETNRDVAMVALETA